MKTKLGILLGIYVIAVAFISTDLNPFLLVPSYRNFINAIPPQLHLILFFLMIPAAGFARILLRNEVGKT